MGDLSEQWRPVVGYEGLYEVSDRGRVRSVPRQVRAKSGSVRMVQNAGLVRKLQQQPSGHLKLMLFKDDRQKWHFVHRLVLEAFVGPPPSAESQCMHLDDNPVNNCVANLRWGTCLENQRQKVRNGRHPQSNKPQCPQGHPYDEVNTYWQPSTGGRACRACNRERQRQRRVAANEGK